MHACMLSHLSHVWLFVTPETVTIHYLTFPTLIFFFLSFLKKKNSLKLMPFSMHFGYSFGSKEFFFFKKERKKKISVGNVK